MVENGWPALLAALAFIISTNLSDELFIDVLSSYQALTNVAGMLALSTPRDALFNSLSKFAIPSRVVSGLESYIEPPTPRTATSFTENLGLTAPVQAPGLSERNLACLKVLVSSALFLAGSLGESWYGILEALQNADYVLNVKGLQASTGRRMSTPMTPGRSVSGTVSGEQGKVSRHPLLMDIDSESVLAAVQRLFDTSKNLEDSALQDFITALCKLSSEMVEMQSNGGTVLESDDSLSPAAALSPHRRRVSGIHLPRTLVSSWLIYFTLTSNFFPAPGRLRCGETRLSSNAKHPPPDISRTRSRMEYDYEPSSLGHGALFGATVHSGTGSTCPGRNSHYSAA
jgi:hypothetical protein